jgi:DNA-binding MltR family transcriptional regulator
MKKRAQNQSQREFPDGREIIAFVATLAAEGERVAVIISGARIDFVLETVLKGLMVPHTAGADPLFDSDRPLSTFSAKVSLSYRLGLIDAELQQAIALIRRIRNDFSHSMRPEHLADSPHRERVNELVKNLKDSPFYNTLYQDLAGVITPAHFCRFCTGVAVVLTSLRVLEKHVARPGDPRRILLIPPRGLIKEK